ncbi:MAG: hypothetical protein JNL05_02750 [Flavobacteriales bacterium]|nr:hypothetical protein [Flavobacteriales bacterium]
MKTRYFSSVIALLALVAPWSMQAQTPTHQSVVNNSIGSTSSVVNGVTADANGNMIITGWRTDALDLGGTAYAQGPGAIFLAKFNAQGNELWTKVSGSAEMFGNHKGMSVATDGAGNIYNAGWIFGQEQATFDGTTLPLGTFGFVAKYTQVGTLLWVKAFPGGVNAIAVDGNGNPFINLGDATIEKLDPANGNSVASAAGSGDLQNVLYHNIEIDASNNVIAQWGNKITKYDNALNQLWSTPLVKPNLAESFRISVDDSGDVWATFYALFGTVTLGGTDYTTFPNGYIYRLDGTSGAVSNCASPGAYKIKKVFHTGGGELNAFGDFAFNDPYMVKYDVNLTALQSVLSFDTKDVVSIGPDCFVLGGAHDADITLDGTTYTRPNGSGQENAIAGYLCAGTVGMEESAAAATLFALAPNPAADRVSITTASQTKWVELTDLRGSTLLRLPVRAGRCDIDLSRLANGVYLVRDDAGHAQRLVIAR